MVRERSEERTTKRRNESQMPQRYGRRNFGADGIERKIESFIGGIRLSDIVAVSPIRRCAVGSRCGDKHFAERRMDIKEENASEILRGESAEIKLVEDHGARFVQVVKPRGERRHK